MHSSALAECFIFSSAFFNSPGLPGLRAPIQCGTVHNGCKSENGLTRIPRRDQLLGLLVLTMPHARLFVLQRIRYLSGWQPWLGSYAVCASEALCPRAAPVIREHNWPRRQHIATSKRPILWAIHKSGRILSLASTMDFAVWRDKLGYGTRMQGG